MKFTAIHSKMARAALGLGVRELADLAKVSPDTIARLERGEELKERTLDAVQKALEAAGVEFTNGGQPGVKMRGQVYRLNAYSHGLNDPSWQRSTPDRLLWTRAESSADARRYASTATSIASPHLPGAMGLTSPWLKESLTGCVMDPQKVDVPFGKAISSEGTIIGE